MTKADQTPDNATHFLKCRHVYGDKAIDYLMPCIVVGRNKRTNMTRILVFGNRFKGNTEKKNYRYVHPNQIELKK